MLAIWARETDYGGYQLPNDAIRVLATQAYVGKRKEFFHNEFLHALKMLQNGVPRSDLRSSWGGAMGLTQFLPSEYFKYAVDFDGDGRADIWRSVPDALASAAKQLVGKGWRSGEPCAIEVRAPATADCSIGVPNDTTNRRMGEKRFCTMAASSLRATLPMTHRFCSRKGVTGRHSWRRKTILFSRTTIFRISMCCLSGT